MGQMLQPVGDAQRTGQLLQPVGVWPAPVQKQGQQDVFPGGEHRQQIELLKDKAHPPPPQSGQGPVVQLPQIGPVVAHTARGWLIQGAEQMEQGAFSAA